MAEKRGVMHILFVAGMLVFLLLAGVTYAKEFKGQVIINEVSPSFDQSDQWDPENDQLAICTDDVKYRMEPNSTLGITLYLRNPMPNRSYRDVDVSIPSDLFGINLTTQHIDVLNPLEVKIINFTVSVPPNASLGNYPVNIIVNTRDYPDEGFFRTKLIIVKNKWKWQHLAFVIIASVIIIAVILRSLWVRRINRKFAGRSRNPETAAIKNRKRKTGKKPHAKTA